MGKPVLLLAFMAAALVLACGVALAAAVRCDGGVCEGTSKADEMLGTVRRDVMSSSGGKDDLYGKGGNDLLDGGRAADGYVFGPDWGRDTISDSDRNFGPDLELEYGLELYSRYGDRLEFPSVGTGLTVRLSPGDGPEATDGTNTVEWAEPHEFYGVLGSEAEDTIIGDENPNVIEGGKGADTLSGGGTSDHLYGEGGDDELFADGSGPYGDELSGGKGDDALAGGDGRTRFHFGPGWEHDTITGDNPEDWYSLSFDYIPPESAWRPYPTTVENPSDLTIHLDPAEGPEATDGVNTVDWDETVDVYGATGGSGDDKLTGNDEYNSLDGGGGADNITAGGWGDDISAGSGGDTVRSGPGNDVVRAFATQRDTGVDRVNCGLGESDEVYIQESNADHVVGCEKIRFTYGGGGY